MKIGRRIGTANRPNGIPSINLSSPQAEGLILWDPANANSINRSNSTFVNYAHGSPHPTMTVSSTGNGTGRTNAHVGFAPTLGAVLNMGGYNNANGYSFDSPYWGLNARSPGAGLTVSFWINGEQDYGNVFKFALTDGRISIRHNGAYSIQVLYNDGSWKNITHTLPADLDDPNNYLYHVACIWKQNNTGSAGHAEIWINGILVQTSADSTLNTATNVSGTYLMADTDEGWAGNIADIRLYNRPFTNEEVWRLYDPRTRWELYEQPSRRIARKAPAPAGALTTAEQRRRALNVGQQWMAPAILPDGTLDATDRANIGYSYYAGEAVGPPTGIVVLRRRREEG